MYIFTYNIIVEDRTITRD